MTTSEHPSVHDTPSDTPSDTPNDDDSDNDGGFAQFLAIRADVALAYVNGDAGPLGQIISHHDPASFFGPGGGRTTGAEEVWRTHRTGARAFGAGSENRLEILHTDADDRIGYWVGLQHAVVQIDGHPVPMTLRVTEVFRREDGDWKLVHRHADPLAEPTATG